MAFALPPELVALIDKPWLLAIVLAAGAAMGIAVERVTEGQKRAERRAYWAGRKAGGRGPFTAVEGTAARRMLDAAEQLRCVMEAEFSPRALLNRPEAAVFDALDKAVAARGGGWQVMAQVSLGEFLSSPDPQAYAAINAKRVDFALMDPQARVRHAIEYQGTGHHLPGSAAAARDAVKKEALRKAGIGYHEVVAGHTTPAELRRLVERLVVGE